MPLKAILLLILLSCNNNKTTVSSANTAVASENTPNKHFNNIGAIPLPDGFYHIAADSTSFAAWLRNVSLKASDSVFLFNGQPKANQTAQFAVLNISVGDKDLQQCADAVMRLRAEYLYSRQQFSDISFTDNNGTAYNFEMPYTRNNFDQYLQRVFGMCGSASLAKQLKPVKMEDMQSGDVLIRGGFPGHAVMVMDVAKNSAGKKIYLLAQSYMPAQDIHILKNPSNEALSPWYELNDAERIITPEYIFRNTELKRW